MNNINYELEILGEKKTYKGRKEFIEPIINSKNKIFEITADNSYGKTFILNLLAYALEADKLDNEKILPSIKESISRYDDHASYNLEYDIDLDLPDNKKLSLTKAKGRNKIIQIDEGAPLSHTILHKNLSVIYDVPTNPSERLDAVIKDLGNWNENLITKFEKVSRVFYDITKEFDSVRNEEKISNLKEKSKKIKEQILEKNQLIEKKTLIINDLNKMLNLKKLSLLFKKNLELEVKINKKTKQFKSLKKPVKIEKKDELKIQQLNSDLAKFEKDFKEIISKLIHEINNDLEIYELITNDSSMIKYYNLIKDTEIKDIFSSNNYVVAQNKFIESIEYIKDAILRFIIEKKNGKSYIIHNSYKQLIDLLEELMDNEIDHILKTATTVESIKLKNQLESIINEYKVKDYDALKRFLNNDLKLIKGYLSQFMKTQNQLKKESKKKLVNDDDSTYYKLQADLKDLKDTFKKVKNNFTLTTATCANELNIDDLSNFNSIDKISDLRYSLESKIGTPKLLEDISSSKAIVEKEIRDLTRTVIDLESQRRLTERSFKMEDAKNPSKYNDEQKIKIKAFLRTIQIINTNLLAFRKLILNIEKGDLSSFKDVEDIKFMELAGKIIAYSMDNKLLRADGIYAKLNFYDMIRQEFHCDGDLIIKKADVSTGLASANYLKQRIENVEGKYVVVLLDEIGNMAQNAINKVIESIKKLENQNRLVLAVLTRPNSNGIKIIEY